MAIMAESEHGRWVKIYSAIVNHPVFSDAQAFRAFFWCIDKARWKRSYSHGKWIPRGSFWCVNKDAAAECQSSINTWRLAMAKLVELELITMETHSTHTLVRVTNYDKYQGSEGGSGVSKIDTPTDTPTDTRSDTPTDNRSRSTRQKKTEEENQASALPPPDGSSNDKPAKPKRIVFDPMAVELPPVLQSDLGRKAWAAWVTHRKEIGKKLTGETVKQQLKQLHEAGPENAVAMIRASIAAGWQGLFPPKQSQSKPYDRPSSMPSVIPGLEWMAEGRKTKGE